MSLTVAAHPGVPGRSRTHGSKGWSSTLIALTEQGDLSVFDTGGPAYRALWPAWLREIGRSVEDVSTVFITHLHWDHVGSFRSFPRARYVVGAGETEWATRNAHTNPYLEPSLIEALLATGRVHRAEDGETIAGATAVATPGHTPGHTSYLVAGGLFVGDAIKDNGELTGGAFAITEDREASERSRARILALRGQGVALLLGHDDWVTAIPESDGRP